MPLREIRSAPIGWDLQFAAGLLDPIGISRGSARIWARNSSGARPPRESPEASRSLRAVWCGTERPVSSSSPCSACSIRKGFRGNRRGFWGARGMIGMAASRHLFTVVVLFAAFASTDAFTDPSDAIGLWELYRTLKSPWQLSGWTFEGGDPCSGDSECGPWHDVFCKGLSVVAMCFFRNISGLGVGRWDGLELLKFHSLKEMDVSFNNIAEI